MLDFVYLASGKTLADRDAYNETARPIAANHGAELQVTLDRMSGATGPLLGGPLLPERLDLWTMQTVHGLQSWGTDPAFQAILPRALEVHDMQQLSVYTIATHIHRNHTTHNPRAHTCPSRMLCSQSMTSGGSSSVSSSSSGATGCTARRAVSPP
ncbi:MAG: hypothetical protein AAF439_14410, partial [Pseudomonadota bacterium]